MTMEWLLIKTTLSLAAVLGLMFLVVLAYRRLIRNGAPGGVPQAQIEIIGRRGIHPKQSVVVIRTLGKVLVVGVTEHGMQTLADINDAAELARLAPAQPPAAASQRTSFAGVLATSIQGFVGHAIHAVVPGRRERGEVSAE